MTMNRGQWRAGAVLLAASVLFGCSGSSGGSPSAVATITATIPPDGTVDVAPDTIIRFVLSDSSSVLNASALVITDGGNTLPGALRQVDGSNAWTWTPNNELPRGCEIKVGRTPNAGVPSVVQVFSTFTVRDSAVTQEFELAGEAPGFSLSWPNGRRAVVAASGNVFEVTSTGLVQRFVVMHPGARAFGDGDFICEEDVGSVHYCVRGNLDGSITRVPTPFSVAIGENNANGDVVAHVSSDVGMPQNWGLWRWMQGNAAFMFAGSVISAGVGDTPSIQSDGTVSLAYSLADRVRLSRFAVGDVVGEHHEVLVEGGGAQFDSADDGTGLLAYSTYAPGTATSVPRVSVHVARYTPGSGLQVFPVEVAGRDQGLPPAGVQFFFRLDGVRVGELGSGCVLIAHGSSQTIGLPGNGPPTPSASTFHEVVRVEPGDRLAPSVMYHYTIGQQPMERSLTHISPARAAVWSVSDFWGPGQTWWLRSRPDDVSLSVIYKNAPQVLPWGPWCFSFDDSGRGMIALTEVSLDNPSMRVVVLN
ncbi:MAG: hypothetical protein ACI89X_000605 [Planctomycetota bacterium]|jgi:hypothetical protein